MILNIEVELQKKTNQSHVKKCLTSIYQSDDDFRFTTMATCTYTVAVIFLYYLACTLVFLSERIFFDQEKLI
jgi:hypothetical protein